MSYIRNAWYPVCWSAEIGDGLTAKTVINEHLVLFRKQDGTVAALEDLCPHRFLPLSEGRRDGDAIECGYHGMSFDCTGQCTRVPGQKIVPASARVRSFPVEERLGLAWIWVGEAAADRDKLYDLPQYGDPQWRAVHGASLFNAANYLSLIDNLLDPSHVSFVHKSSLGTPGGRGRDVPVQTESEGGEVVVWRWILDAPPIPLFAKSGLFKGNVDRWHYYRFTPPTSCVIDFGTAEAGALKPEARHTGLQIYACHFITPIDERSCIDHWLHVRNFRIDDVEMDRQLNTDLAAAFLEDKAILESIQRQADRHPGRPQLHLALDGGPVRMRRLINRLIKSEATSSEPAATAAE